MHARHRLTLTSIAACTLLLTGCASLQNQDPVQVFLVGANPLRGEGLEIRMLLKLRLQNPNSAPLDYTGVYVKLEVQGKTFASGVNAISGSVPGFGEGIVELPVSVSVLRMVRQVIGFASGGMPDKFAYEMTGKLATADSRSVRFKAKGEFDFPVSELPETQL